MRDATTTVRTVEEFFEGRRFGIPTYQRAYTWPDGHLRQLLDDLVRCWQQGGLSIHDEGDYFLGMVVTSVEGSEPTLRLVDGQQRATTLVLLLKALAAKGSDEIRERIDALIDPTPQTFVMAVSGFRDAIVKMSADSSIRRRFRSSDRAADLTRLTEAYAVIEHHLAVAIGDDSEQITDFAEWLLEHVFVVELFNASPFDDQTLFDRINTRGYPLSGADVFRSRVTVHVSTWSKPAFLQGWSDARSKAAHAFGLNPTTGALEAERLAITAWLIGRYATGADALATTRQILKDPYDWAYASLPIHAGDEERVPDLFKKDFFPLVHALEEPINAQRSFRRELAGFYSANLLKVPLIDALASAVLKPTRRTGSYRDDLRLVSRFLDAMAARSRWGPGWCDTHGRKLQLISEAIDVASQHTGASLARMLTALLANSPNFDPHRAPRLDRSNKTWVRYFLCRIAAHLSMIVRGKDEADTVLGANAKFEIEHVMANYHDFRPAFPSPTEWQTQRERLGALVVLPKRINASIRDASYVRKLEEYSSQTALAATLSPGAYDGRLRFKGARGDRNSFVLIPHPEMKPEVIDERERLYCAIAENLWPRSLTDAETSRYAA